MHTQVTTPTIYIVEDSTALSDSYSEVLQFNDYITRTAETAEDALKNLETSPSPPDLIISDVRLPGMDGIKFFHKVRAKSKLAHIPFVFVSGQAEFPDDLISDTVAYLSKPVDVMELLTVVERLLS